MRSVFWGMFSILAASVSSHIVENGVCYRLEDNGVRVIEDCPVGHEIFSTSCSTSTTTTSSASATPNSNSDNVSSDSIKLYSGLIPVFVGFAVLF